MLKLLLDYYALDTILVSVMAVNNEIKYQFNLSKPSQSLANEPTISSMWMLFRLAIGKIPVSSHLTDRVDFAEHFLVTSFMLFVVSVLSTKVGKRLRQF